MTATNLFRVGAVGHQPVDVAARVEVMEVDHHFGGGGEDDGQNGQKGGKKEVARDKKSPQVGALAARLEEQVSEKHPNCG